ncbi:hypothetical protein T439DRAFT_225461 [Meredithblackwellia eburnea MCA 4105]
MESSLSSSTSSTCSTSRRNSSQKMSTTANHHHHHQIPLATNPLPPPSPPQPTAGTRISALATFAAEHFAWIWFAPPPSRDDDGDQDEKGKVPEKQQLVPSERFLRFCHDVLATTQVSHSVVILALLFVYRLKSRNVICGAPGSEFRLAITALMMANKVLDDNTYTAKTWSDVSSLELKPLVAGEAEFLRGLDFKLHVTERDFGGWIKLLEGHVAVRRSQLKLSSSEKGEGGGKRRRIVAPNSVGRDRDRRRERRPLLSPEPPLSGTGSMSVKQDLVGLGLGGGEVLSSAKVSRDTRALASPPPFRAPQPPAPLHTHLLRHSVSNNNSSTTNSLTTSPTNLSFPSTPVATGSGTVPPLAQTSTFHSYSTSASPLFAPLSYLPPHPPPQQQQPRSLLSQFHSGTYHPETSLSDHLAAQRLSSSVSGEREGKRRRRSGDGDRIVDDENNDDDTSSLSSFPLNDEGDHNNNNKNPTSARMTRSIHHHKRSRLEAPLLSRSWSAGAALHPQQYQQGGMGMGTAVPLNLAMRSAWGLHQGQRSGGSRLAQPVGGDEGERSRERERGSKRERPTPSDPKFVHLADGGVQPLPQPTVIFEEDWKYSCSPSPTSPSAARTGTGMRTRTRTRTQQRELEFYSLAAGKGHGVPRRTSVSVLSMDTTPSMEYAPAFSNSNSHSNSNSGGYFAAPPPLQLSQSSSGSSYSSQGGGGSYFRSTSTRTSPLNPASATFSSGSAGSGAGAGSGSGSVTPTPTTTSFYGYPASGFNTPTSGVFVSSSPPEVFAASGAAGFYGGNYAPQLAAHPHHHHQQVLSPYHHHQQQQYYQHPHPLYGYHHQQNHQQQTHPHAPYSSYANAGLPGVLWAPSMTRC